MGRASQGPHLPTGYEYYWQLGLHVALNIHPISNVPVVGYYLRARSNTIEIFSKSHQSSNLASSS